MREYVIVGSALVAATAFASSAAAQSSGAYVDPRLPLGHARLATGHAVAVGGGRGSGPRYVAPRMTYVYGLPEAVQAGEDRVHIYVVVPDFRINPSEVTIDPPEVRIVPAPDRPPVSAEERSPRGT